MVACICHALFQDVNFSGVGYVVQNGIVTVVIITGLVYKYYYFQLLILKSPLG